MTVASCIDKQAVIHFLDLCAKRGFHIFLWIVGYLLEFVNSEDAGHVGLLQILEYFFESQFWGVDVPQFDIECGCVGNRIVAETSC